MLKRERAQANQHVFKFVFHIFLNEELRVRKTRLDDLLIPICDHVRAVTIPITHNNKERQ